MRVLQVFTCLAIIVAPYWILFNKTSLTHNVNNGWTIMRSVGYYVLANAVKVFLMATGIPELVGNHIVNEDIVMAMFNAVLYLGLLLPLRGKANANTNVSSIVLGIAIGWSLPENIGRTLFQIVSTLSNADESNVFLYNALQTNLHVLASVIFTALLFLWQREETSRMIYAIMIIATMVICPVMTTFNKVGDDVVLNNFIFLGIQMLMALVLGAVVKRAHFGLQKAHKHS
ncbi:transmembrane protein [Babesia ovis]|uniref:BOS complex subunit TMEM147 n=1 Tax=Babesia ovis TaxID=5869 RepID=A0A9W5TF79_BABOV|nr:transmembrane protein [Babesia ovis]